MPIDFRPISRYITNQLPAWRTEEARGRAALAHALARYQSLPLQAWEQYAATHRSDMAFIPISDPRRPIAALPLLDHYRVFGIVTAVYKPSASLLPFWILNIGQI